jgi:hypothetical protein
MPVNLSALLQRLQQQAQQPPLAGPAMGGVPPDGALGGPADFRNPYMTRPAPQQGVGAAIADAIQSATGWQPGTTPSWMPQSLVDASNANKAAAMQNQQALAKYGFTPEDAAIAMGFAGPTGEAEGAKGLLGGTAPAADVAPGITAYHGSPHSFDRFDISKIGTGEGAQAYGHGLYFAENEGVARDYRDTLAAPRFPSLVVNKDADGWGLYDASAGAPGQPQKLGTFGTKSAAMAEVDQRLKQVEQAAPPGSMYQARINAAPEHFLDWDKPLSEQSPQVQAALGELGMHEKDATGGQIHDWLVNREGGQAGGTEALQSAGIPGIRYLDQGSRGAGAGTHNYVVFSDKIIDILKKYGLAGLGLLGAGGLGAAAMPNQAQAGQK